MELGEFLRKIDLDKARAGPAGKVSIDCAEPAFLNGVHTQYIQLLVAVGQNPGMAFLDVAMVADGVVDGRQSIILDRPGPVVAVMHMFHAAGLLDIKDYYGKDFEHTDYATYAGGARYSLNDEGCSDALVVKVEALHARDTALVHQLYRFR